MAEGVSDEEFGIVGVQNESLVDECFLNENPSAGEVLKGELFLPLFFKN